MNPVPGTLGPQEIGAIGGVVGSLCRLFYNAGLSGRSASTAAAVITTMVLAIFAYAHQNFDRNSSWDYFVAWVDIIGLAAGVFHIVENTPRGIKDAVKTMTGTGPGGAPMWLLVWVLALSTTSSGCLFGLDKLVAHPPSQVQIVAAAADGIDAANALGEVVESLRATSHKLHQAHVLGVETDNAVQQAAIAFANAKDIGVTAMNQATSAAQILAAAAPLVGAATSVRTALKDVNVTHLTGAAAIVGSQLGPLLKQSKNLIAKLGGNAS